MQTALYSWANPHLSGPQMPASPLFTKSFLKGQVTVPSTVHTSSHLILSVKPLNPLSTGGNYSSERARGLPRVTQHVTSGALRGISVAMPSAGVRLPVPLPVFVLLPWREGRGAAPGGGGPTAPTGPRSPWSRSAHSFGPVGLLHPGWVKVWRCGPGARRAAKQGLVHVRRPGLDLIAAPAAVLTVEGLHPTDGPLRRGPHAARGPG